MHLSVVSSVYSANTTSIKFAPKTDASRWIEAKKWLPCLQVPTTDAHMNLSDVVFRDSKSPTNEFIHAALRHIGFGVQ